MSDYIQLPFRLFFFIEANNINPNYQFDLGPYCLQYRLPKNIKQMREQATKVVTGGLRVNTCTCLDMQAKPALLTDSISTKLHMLAHK